MWRHSDFAQAKPSRLERSGLCSTERLCSLFLRRIPADSTPPLAAADLVAMAGGRIVALGEAKLRPLGEDDLARLLRLRTLLGARDATLVLASATRVDLPDDAEAKTVSIVPADVYG